MKAKTSLTWITLLAVFVAFAPIAEGKDKKKHGQRGMLESMQSVPCGAKERGLAGLGSVFGSVGVEHVNSHEQLCPQYLLRTDEMDYHIRPMDTKHAAVLPIGHEAEFKIKNDRLFLKVPDGDKKVRPFEVVSMQPVSADSKGESSSYHPSSREKEAESRPLNHEDSGNLNDQANKVPPPQ
jgi:hypothetical protein